METEGRNRGLTLGGLALIDSSDTGEKDGHHPVLNDGSLVRIVGDENDGILAVEPLMPVGEIRGRYGLACVSNEMLLSRARDTDEEGTMLVPDFNEDRVYLWVREDNLRAVEDNHD